MLKLFQNSHDLHGELSRWGKQQGDYLILSDLEDFAVLSDLTFIVAIRFRGILLTEV